MADEVEPRAGELTTANYGWTKPNISDSDDAWGGMLNTDLDGIDATVKAVSNVANAAAPLASPTFTGTPNAPTVSPTTDASTKIATTAFVQNALPVASSTAPAMDGTAAVGAGTTWARADHVHPSDTTRLPLAGGTLTGPLNLAADPTANLGAATKQYVDGAANSVRHGDNRIINGDMRIDQRNNGASGTAGGAGTFVVDRWKYFCSTTARGTWGRNLNAIAGPPGFPYYLGFQSSSAYTAAAADNFQINQPIEADMVSDFAFGAANAQAVTLSFWVYSSLTGTFGGVLVNYAGTRSYPFTFSIPTANTWTRVVINIPGDTAGAWVMSGNAGSMVVTFDLGSGSNFRGTANAWASANLIGVTGAVSIVATNGATFYVTGVKLEIGSIATPFNYPPLAQALAACQRYYQVLLSAMAGRSYVASASQTVYSYLGFMVAMRAAPTIAFANVSYNNGSGIGSTGVTTTGFSSSVVGTVVGQAWATVDAQLSAEL